MAQRVRRRFVIYALSGLLLVAAISAAGQVRLRPLGFLALTRSPELIFGNPDREVLVTCTARVKVAVIQSVKARGLPVLGNTIRLDASLVKIFAQVPTLRPGLFSASCDSYYAGLPEAGFEWELVERPGGSGATLEEAATLTPTLRLDQPGEYVVRFAACEDESCPVTINDQVFTATPDSKTLTIEALSEVAIPPEFQPKDPDTPMAPGTRFELDGLCGRWPDYTAPAWQTARPWNGAADYDLLEGRVNRSHSTTDDNVVNHDEMDWNIFVVPDPQYRHLLPVGLPVQGNLEVEWERPRLHVLARPTRGDRASVLGYWINDCAHGGKTEIHPPVMVAAHRPRPILLPDSVGMGNNVYIAGISSTVYVNRHAGETTRNCSRTGLHEARSASNGCLPDTKGFDGDDGNPIDTVFTYHILLPRNPADVLADLGREVPRAELYHRIYRPLGGAGPDPQIEETSVGGVPALRVQFDLRGYGRDSYARRIEAGWIYPAPDNWGLRRWRVRLDSVEVHDDMDADVDLLIGDIDNDGDWRLWMNVPNGFWEWFMVFDEDCDGCVQEGIENFGGDPWETGDIGVPHSLGPDVALFAGQPLWLHASGFEDDGLMETNPLGHVNLLLPQEEGTYRPRSDKDVYTLHLTIREGPPITPPRLSFLGRRTYERYLIRPDSDRPRFPDLELAPVNYNHPDQLELSLGSPPFDLADSDFFAKQEGEPLTITGISTEEFQRRLADSREHEPEAVDAAFRELREEIDRLLLSPKNPDVLHNMRLLEGAIPGDLWDQYFGDIDVEALGPDRALQVPWWWVLLAVLGVLFLLIVVRLFR